MNPVAGHNPEGGAPLEGSSHEQQSAVSSGPNAEEHSTQNEQEANCHSGSEDRSGIQCKQEGESEVDAGTSLKRSRLSGPPLAFCDIYSLL